MDYKISYNPGKYVWAEEWFLYNEMVAKDDILGLTETNTSFFSMPRETYS
jgi:hypothetical protein